WYVPEAKLWHKVNSLTGGSGSAFTARYCTRNRVYFLLKSQSALVARFWIAVYRGYLFLRFVLRRDSFRAWDLKRAAVAEGWEMGWSYRRRALAER
ncbi:hypothetical protein, partial [Acidithiobacillus sp.]|uniref:hypothetical protein n=1 Tax=Acidithiobacillus sp. TaxID=1872118 RepID=UPI003D024ADB